MKKNKKEINIVNNIEDDLLDIQGCIDTCHDECFNQFYANMLCVYEKIEIDSKEYEEYKSEIKNSLKDKNNILKKNKYRKNRYLRKKNLKIN